MSAGPIIVTHSGGSYPVYVEPGGLARLGELANEHLRGRRLVLLADVKVYQLYRAGRLSSRLWDADPLVLGSLPERIFVGRLAEAVKHGLVADRQYFQWLETHASKFRERDPEALAQLIRRSVEIKADVVSEDERESGRRAILNAGH